MKRSLLTLLLASGIVFAAQKKEEPSPEPPPPEPISLKIVGDNKIVLDRGGRSAADYAAAVKAGTVAPLACGLSLKITNHTKETLKVRVTGSAPNLTLELKGKGEVASGRVSGKEKSRITYADLAPGASTEIPLTTLSNFRVSGKTHLHPTEPGDYDVKATFSTYVFVAPKEGELPGKGKSKIGTPFKGKNPHTMTAKHKITVTLK